MKKLMECTVSVFGLGLLGASLAWKLASDGSAKGVAGWSRNPATVRRAEREGMITIPCTSAEECASLGDVLILAVPIRSMEETARRIAPSVRPDACALFDLASTKVEVGRVLAGLWGARYAGFHPMAGKERGGIENADRELFQGASCVVVPFPETGREAVSLAEELAGALGGRALETDPAGHDAVTACISHFPVLAAASLALLAERERKDRPLLPLLAAGGFRDTTRVAGGPAWLGADMVATNGEQIRRLAGVFREILDGLLAASPEELEAMLSRASTAREEILSAKEAWRREGQ
jgi:prephenate dehydrogenase